MSLVAAPIWGAPPSRPRVAPPASADVVVVGGGITGVALLHWFAARGVRCVLVERERLAAGASGRNAGFLLMGVAANYAMAVRQYGRDVAREVWHFTAENHELLAPLLGAPPWYARRGSATLAASAAEVELLRESETLLREDGLPGTWVEAEGALVNERDGEVDPVKAVAVLALGVPDAVIAEGVAAQGVEAGGDGVVVRTTAGPVRAGVAILATNAYTPDLAATVPIAPVRAQMLATAPHAGRVASRVTYSNFGYRYWRQRDDGRVLLGGWRDTAVADEVGSDATPTDGVQRHLDAHLGEMGVSAPVTHRWAGIMGFSPDELPLVGAVDGMPHVYVCGGYTGHGMGFAVHAARTLVAHILDGAALPPWLRADRPGLTLPAPAPA